MKKLKLLALILLTIGFHSLKAQTTNNEAIDKILRDYLEVKNSLAADNSKAANSAAMVFVKSLKEVNPGKLDAAQNTAWKQYAEKLRYNGEHISESTQIAHQREHFGALSADLYAVLKTFKSADMVVYEQYCPMAKKTWLSETKAIKNPYYGKKMLDCGVTRETLN